MTDILHTRIARTTNTGRERASSLTLEAFSLEKRFLPILYLCEEDGRMRGSTSGHRLSGIPLLLESVTRRVEYLSRSCGHFSKNKFAGLPLSHNHVRRSLYRSQIPGIDVMRVLAISNDDLCLYVRVLFSTHRPWPNRTKTGANSIRDLRRSSSQVSICKCVMVCPCVIRKKMPAACERPCLCAANAVLGGEIKRSVRDTSGSASTRDLQWMSSE